MVVAVAVVAMTASEVVVMVVAVVVVVKSAYGDLHLRLVEPKPVRHETWLCEVM